MIPEHITVEILETGVKLKNSDLLPEIIYSADFVYTLKFTAKIKTVSSGGSGEGSGGTTPPPTSSESTVNATNVIFESPFDGVIIKSTSPDTIQITGSYLTAFGDYYKFVRKSGEQVILPPNTRESNIALIQYKMPLQTTRTFKYNFSVEWPEGSSYDGIQLGANIEIEQESFWTTSAASDNIAKLKNKGF